MVTRFQAGLRLLVAFGAAACGGISATPTGRSAAPVPNITPGVTASACAADFDSTYAVITRDYAGYADRVRESGSRINALTDSVRVEVQNAATDSACTRALQRWIAVFRERDHHLQLGRFRRGPAPAGQAPPATGAPAEDPRRPTIQFMDDSTAVLRLGTFNMFYKAAIDSLIAVHRGRLLATPYLVVDVRTNTGGATHSYATVMSFIYSDPFRVEGMDVWATDGNVAYYKAMLETADLPESIKAEGRIAVPRLEANRGRFTTWDEDRTVRLDTVYPMPRRVAVLIAGLCASSCEQFVLDARQSRKVTVLGRQNTAGMVDYGNTRRVILPSGVRQIHMPTSRSRRLPERPMDYKGIAPDVPIPKDEPDALAFAIRYLKSAGDQKQ
ncbi:MAG: S41 family peptidase [Gemmatimonadota bacterium]|nr:S41 family peptidase [Gemmatimonadota bacterium]